MRPHSVSVRAVVDVILCYNKKLKKRCRFSSPRVSDGSVKERLATGIAIHKHMDPYRRMLVPVYSELDIRALKLLNLMNKLEDLLEHRSVCELELKVPWHTLIDETESKDMILLTGVLDAVHVDGKKILVEELKTHNIVTNDGRPLVENRTLMSHKYQVLLYSLLLQKFLNSIRTGCPYLRQAYVGQETVYDAISGHIQKIMLPSHTINELYDRVCSLVKQRFKKMRVSGAKVIHVSQSLAKRAIYLDSDDTIAYEEYHQLKWTSLKRQLACVDPWKIISNVSRS